MVICLQSTRESQTNSVVKENEGKLTGIVSSTKETLKSVITDHYPSAKNVKRLRKKEFDDDIEEVCGGDASIQAKFLKHVMAIDEFSPLNTLDQLISEFGGPENWQKNKNSKRTVRVYLRYLKERKYQRYGFLFLGV